MHAYAITYAFMVSLSLTVFGFCLTCIIPDSLLSKITPIFVSPQLVEQNMQNVNMLNYFFPKLSFIPKDTRV